MARLVILKTGSTYPDIRKNFGDFEHWFRNRLGEHSQVEVVDVVAGADPGWPRDWDGILVTGSPAMVTDREAWSERTATWLAEAVAQSVPVLGVCYGHQLLAHALGGEAGYRTQGRESGTFDVGLLPEARQDALFSQLPDSFPAQLTHGQSVLRLPPEATLLATSEGDNHQAFRVGRHAWGVQFHPEFTADIMRAYLGIQTPALRDEGQHVEQLLRNVQDAPAASGLIERFAAYAEEVAATGGRV